VNLDSHLPRTPGDNSRACILAWGFSLASYFLEFAVRLSPDAMIPQLTKTFKMSTVGVSDVLRTHYYTYSIAGLIAGVLLDRVGAKYIAPDYPQGDPQVAGIDAASHSQYPGGPFWMLVLIAALLLGSLLKETGRRNVALSRASGA